MKTNRTITRSDAASLDLNSRVKLEIEITDAEATYKAQVRTLRHDSLQAYASRSPWRRHLFWFLGDLSNQTVLDLGCGYHPTAIYFALAGAKHVFACDVSPKAVEYINEMAESAGVSDRVTGVVCAAEQLPFADGEIDIMHGEAVLHHLQTELAGPELARVLKAGGRAGFKDPLGHNALLEFARDYLPYKFKAPAKGTDKPLRYEQLEDFAEHFSKCEYKGFGFASIPVIGLIGRETGRLQEMSHEIDDRLLRMAPFMRKYCRFVVTCATK